MNEADNEKGLSGSEGTSSSPGMRRLVGIKFKVAGKTHFFDAGPLLFNIGEMVVVESDKGLGMGRVVTLVREVPAERVPPDTRRIIRRANWNDLERQRKNREREIDAFTHCLERIKERNLDMKLIRVEYLHDASKAIFYYTAQQRVDFRELVKDLAHRLHTRIEMKQIGVRDEAKLVGGLGNCGRHLCCSTFLSDFTPVSVRMAKDQNLAMNPAKVSGVCGRLMCCLAYEYETYEDMLSHLPKKGRWVLCPKGRGRIIDINIFTKKAQVILEDGAELIVDVSDLKVDTTDARNQSPADKEEEGDPEEES
jgi:cell fate regulator YaaT (PSP1 superfamily)